MLEQPLPKSDTSDWPFLVPAFARALERSGRLADVQALLKRTADAAAGDIYGSALNIDGYYITMAGQQKEWPQLLARSDAFLARAATLGPSINASATLAVRAWRACALSQLHRADEGVADAALVLSAAASRPSIAMNLHLCRGDGDAARALLVARLADPNQRAWALTFVQPRANDPETPLEREQRALIETVRTAPEVVAAAEAVGRVLPAPLADGLPDGFDPFRTQPRPADGALPRSAA